MPNTLCLPVYSEAILDINFTFPSNTGFSKCDPGMV